MPKKRWTPEKVIEELKRTRQDGPKMHPQLDAAARRYFGSVRAALDAAGLPCGKRPPPYNDWSKQTVVDAIRQRHNDRESLWRTNREDPSLYSAGKRLFGTWTKARAAAGLPKPTRDFYSPDEVCMKIIELYERELPLAFSSHNDEKLRRSARKHFGGWRGAVKSLGLESELPRQWTEQNVLEAIRERRAAGHCLYKTHAEDKSLFAAAVKRFGDWQKALKAAGLDVKTREKWSKDKVIERLRALGTKFPGENIRNIDSNLAHAAARRFGTLGKAIEAAGIEPPRRRWTEDRIISAIQERYIAGEPQHIEGLGDIPLAQAAKRRFGTWAAAVEAAGLVDRITVRKPLRYWTADDVIAEIQKWHTEGHEFKDVWTHYTALVNAARRHFPTWRAAMEAAGFQCGRRNWDQPTIIREIQIRHRAGKSLTSDHPDNINLAAASIRYFGSWTAAKQSAGVPSKQTQRKVAS
ncbi:hypothetical protein NHH03_12755 [Stieleria sp. TO1_6]|uniref:hypothetical protein n=1 Tax=Stieleria tagensis TaxID=2956795 RepID=UPI00209B54DB|nr:hypothetical protein [Stieleria tagensis]MCO8122609.1 hypothetical protein [Stieleria tagensis]